MRRCLHDRKRSHTFKSGEVMWLCPDCAAGSGHYNQDCPSGPLYHKTGMVEESVHTTDDPEESQEEFSELTLPTFAEKANCRRVFRLCLG